MRRSVRIVCLSAKPGKTDRNPAPNRLTFLPSRFGAKKEHFFAARRAPGSHMRPVQVYLAMRKRSVNLNPRETAMAFAYPRDVRNSEAAIQFRQVQNCIHIAFVAKSENS